MASKIQIGLVEDNPRLVTSISANLAMFEEIEVVFIANNGREAVAKAQEFAIDAILMDINMPVMDGIEATRQISELKPEMKIIMLTVFDENDKIFDSILAGATGYMLKDEKTGRIVEALLDAMDGGAPMSPVIASKALGLLRDSSGSRTKEEGAKKFNLSPRELEILIEISGGLNYQQIADKLFIAPKTVRKHIENIYRKLQVHSKLEAVQLAAKHKMI